MNLLAVIFALLLVASKPKLTIPKSMRTACLRLFSIIFLFAFFCHHSISAVDASGQDIDPASNRQLNFNDDWLFCLGEARGFQQPDFDDSGWRPREIPHDWSVEGAFDPDNPSGGSGGFLPAGTG